MQAKLDNLQNIQGGKSLDNFKERLQKAKDARQTEVNKRAKSISEAKANKTKQAVKRKGLKAVAKTRRFFNKPSVKNVAKAMRPASLKKAVIPRAKNIVKGGLKAAVKSFDLFPIYVGNATNDHGVELLMDAVRRYIPSPATISKRFCPLPTASSTGARPSAATRARLRRSR